MIVTVVVKATIQAMTSGADFFTCARANWGFPASAGFAGDGLNVIHYVDEVAEGATVHTSQGTVAGNSTPVITRAPSYFPVATRGSECAAIIEGFAWADANLLKGYEFCELSAAQGVSTYFVSGVLNSSQTLANDPFDNAAGKGGEGMVSAACWSDSYASGMNPYA